MLTDLSIRRAPLIRLCSSPFLVMSEGEIFCQSLTNAAMLSHQQESFQHTHRHGLPCCHRHGCGSGWESCPVGGGTPLVCVQTPALHGRCFWKEEESKLYLAFLWLTICSLAKASTTLFSCQVIYPQCWAPVPCSWLISLVAEEAEAIGLSLPLFQSPTAANSSCHQSLFLKWKHKWSIVRNLCDFSPDMTVPA